MDSNPPFPNSWVIKKKLYTLNDYLLIDLHSHDVLYG